MSVADKLIGLLDGVQGRGPRWRALCPAHTSKHKTRTLAVFEAEDGRVLVHCFAGCDVQSIVSAVGLEIDDLFPPREVPDGAPRPRKPWRERDAVHALGHELHVAWVLLADLAAGRPIGKSDRERAKVCADRCAALIQEMGA